jgi:hypothetical protein
MLVPSTGFAVQMLFGPARNLEEVGVSDFEHSFPSLRRMALRSGASPWRVFDIDQLKVTETRCVPSHNTPDEPVSLSFGQALTNDQDMTILYT